MNDFKKRFWSIVLTIVILSILIFSGPANAITLKIERTDGTSNPYEYDKVKFKAIVDLHTNDEIPINSIDILIDSTPDDDFRDATRCSFYLDGTPFSNNSDICDITIDSIKTNYNSLGYGYGYGHGYGFTSSNKTAAVRDYSFGYGLYYGYAPGFGYDTYTENTLSNAEIVVEFTWKTPGVSADKEYKIGVGVHAGTSTEFISKNSVTLTVMNHHTASSFISEEAKEKGVNFQIILGKNDADVENIVLNLEKQVQNVIIQVEEAPKSSIVVSAGKKVYKYIHVTLENYAEKELNYAKIRFKVAKEWTVENNVAKEDIVLKRLVGTEWVDLNTSYVDEDKYDYYYEAITPGFSYFAIAVRSARKQQQQVVINSTSKEKPNVTVNTCPQKITDAIDPKTGNCVEFASPCEVPKNWKIVNKCKPRYTKQGEKIEPEIRSGITSKEVAVILFSLVVIALFSWLIYRARNPRNPIRRYRRRRYHYRRH